MHFCSVVCDPKCHTGSFDDYLDHGEERTEHCIERKEHCIASIIKLGYASCSYALVGQIHDNFTLIPHTVPFAVPSLSADMFIAMSTNPTFITTSADASMNHMTVGDYSPMSSMQVSDESEDFCVALTLDMIDILTTDYVIPTIDLDIVEAACVVTSLAIEKEASILSSIVDHVSSQEYMGLHNVSCVSDIESANGNEDILPISPGLYELVTSMEDVWTLALTDTLSVGSDCACPDATIAESAN